MTTLFIVIFCISFTVFVSCSAAQDSAEDAEDWNAYHSYTIPMYVAGIICVGSFISGCWTLLF